MQLLRGHPRPPESHSGSDPVISVSASPPSDQIENRCPAFGFLGGETQLSDPPDDFPYLLEGICVLLVSLREEVKCLKSTAAGISDSHLPSHKGCFCWRTRIWGCRIF